MNLAADPPRHAALVEPHRNQERLIERSAPGAIERVPDLRLERAFFAHREVREAGHEEIRGLDRLFDGSRPVLAWQQLPPVEPGRKSPLLELREETIRPGPVLFYIRQEDFRLGVRNELICAAPVTLEHP